MSERPEFPTRRDVIESIVEEYLNNLHTGFAARVQSYDAATQTADLQPLVRFPVKQPDGSYVMEDLPTLPSVPILFPRSGAWFVAMSVEIGDFVRVTCLESSHGAWEAGQGDATDPGDIARHHLAHAVATPGYFPLAKALAHAPSGTGASASMVIGNDNGIRMTLRADGSGDVTLPAGKDWTFNGGSTPVAKEGSATTGHTHVFALTAGPYTVAGTITDATDTIATAAGSPNVKVP